LRLLRGLDEYWKESPLAFMMYVRKCTFNFELGDYDAIFRTLDDLSMMMPDEASSESQVWGHWIHADMVGLMWRLSMEQVPKDAIEQYAKVFHLIRTLRPNQKFMAFDGVFQALASLLAEEKTSQIQVPFLTSTDLPRTSSDFDPQNLALPYFWSSQENDIGNQIEQVGKPISDAILSMQEESNPEKTVKFLLKVRRQFSKLGGLDSTRDILHQIVLSKALEWAESRQPEALRTARFLSMERLSLRPSSPYTWLCHSRLLTYMNDESAAQSAKGRAMDLGYGQGGQFGG